MHSSVTGITMLSILAFSTSSVDATEPSIQAKLPPETVTLRSSALPGYALSLQKCGICHSADYIAYQPPALTAAQWRSEVVKMQHSYGAPIDDSDIPILADYLVTAYGDAKSLPASPAPTKVATTVVAKANDAASLLDANGCLGCHRIDVKLVGPAYHEVAAKYRSENGAAGLLSNSIRSGSVGKWGPVPMPAFSGLSDAELNVLAEFILRQ